MGVLLFHACYIYRTNQETPPPLLGLVMPIIAHGWFGVDVFFLISGYGLAAKLTGMATLAGSHGAVAFAWNRVWRIYPVYWLSCLLAVILAAAASHFNHMDWHKELPLGPSGWFTAILLLDPVIPLLPSVTWALSIELACYAIVAASVLFRRQLGDRVLLGAATVLAFANAVGWQPKFEVFFSFWPEFTCGLLVFAAVQEIHRGQIHRCRAFVAILIALGLVAGLAGQPRLAATAGLGLALVAIWPHERIISSRSWLRGLTWCGLISYPLFLLHVPLLTRVFNLSQRLVRPDSPAFLLVILFTVFLCLAVAWAVHRWIERPLLALTKRTVAVTA